MNIDPFLNSTSVDPNSAIVIDCCYLIRSITITSKLWEDAGAALGYLISKTVRVGDALAIFFSIVL